MAAYNRKEEKKKRETERRENTSEGRKEREENRKREVEKREIHLRTTNFLNSKAESSQQKKQTLIGTKHICKVASLRCISFVFSLGKKCEK